MLKLFHISLAALTLASCVARGVFMLRASSRRNTRVWRVGTACRGYVIARDRHPAGVTDSPVPAGARLAHRTMSVPARFLLLAFLYLSPVWAGADGRALYLTHCAGCHGKTGAGGLGVPLAMVDLLAVAEDEYFRRTIRLGRPGRHMPAFTQLSNGEVDAVVAYLRSWAPQQQPQPIKVGRGDVMNGEILYGNWCGLCHGAHGEGASTTGITWSWDHRREVAAPALNNPGFLHAASDAMIKRTLIRGRHGTAMPSFLMSELEDEDLDDIVAFVRSFQDDAGGNDPFYRQAQR